jgi:hypothetical protein
MPGELGCELWVDVLSSSVSLQASEQYAAESLSTCLSQARQNWWDQRSAIAYEKKSLLGVVGVVNDESLAGSTVVNQECWIAALMRMDGGCEV